MKTENIDTCIRGFEERLIALGMTPVSPGEARAELAALKERLARWEAALRRIVLTIVECRNRKDWGDDALDDVEELARSVLADAPTGESESSDG